MAGSKRESEYRLALAEALPILYAIIANRYAPTTEKERAAVAELERIIGLCERAMDWPVQTMSASSKNREP